MRVFALAILTGCAALEDGPYGAPPDLSSAMRQPEQELAAGLRLEEHHATVAMVASGAMVGTWRTEGLDGDIYARWFDPDFVQDPAQVVVSGLDGWTDYPDIVALGERFVLTHAEGNNLALRDSASGRSFDVGVPVFKREMFELYAHFPDLAWAPASAGASLLVTWLASPSVTSTDGFYQARWFDQDLALVNDTGRPITLSDTGVGSNPADVVGLPDGRFAAVYARNGTIWLQFLADGALDGDPIDVSGVGASANPSRPMVTAAPSGRLVVSWHDRDDATRDLTQATLRVLAPDGSPLGPRTPIGQDSALASRPVTTFLGEAWVLVSWSEYLEPGGEDEDVFVQIWSAGGLPAGPVERVNQRTAGRQKRSALAAVEVKPGRWQVGFVWETVPPNAPLSVRTTRWTIEVP